MSTITSNVQVLLKALSSQSEIPELEFCRNNCSVEPVGDGYMNVVYRIWQQQNCTASITSAIVKQAPSTNKLSQMCSHLQFDPNRGKIEYLALTQFHRILPESVPKPYLIDEPSRTLVMEDLRHHVNLRKAVIGCDVDASVLIKVAKHLATWHRETCLQYLREPDFSMLKHKFLNSTQTELFRQFTFVKPFCSTDISNRPNQGIRDRLHLVYDDSQVLLAVEELQAIFLEKKQCLIHSDLHTGSVMVFKQDVKIIDTEFARVGPAAMDVGTYLAHLLFSYHAHKLYPKAGATEFHSIIGQAIRQTLTVYLSEFRPQGERQASLITEIAGFTGLQLVRCIIGMAYTEDIEDKPESEMVCFITGIRLLKHYRSLQSDKAVLACLF